MSILRLYTDDDKFINIPKNKCISVEIELNKSDNGKKWIKLGDKLYYFCNPRNNNIDDVENNFKVTNEQYFFIKEIVNNL